MIKKDFKEVFQGANPAAIDLLERMLELDAEKRITAEQALSHHYLEKYADPNDEPTSPPYDQSFEDMELPVEKWKGNNDFFSNLPLIIINLILIYNFVSDSMVTELVFNEVVNFVPNQFQISSLQAQQ